MIYLNKTTHEFNKNKSAAYYKFKLIAIIPQVFTKYVEYPLIITPYNQF
jgi:hypothetical protein